MSDQRSNAGWIRNPLSMIAVFASFAEVAAAAALTQLPIEIQWVFVFFVMSFPSVLVGLFFFILWKNPIILFGPGDFRSDENFLSNYPSIVTATNGYSVPDTQEEEVSEEDSSNVNSSTGDDHTLNINAQTTREKSLFSEQVVFRALEQHYKDRFASEVKLSGSNYTFDCIVEDPKKIQVIEIRYLNSGFMAKRSIEKLLAAFERIKINIQTKWRNGISLRLIVVVNDEHKYGVDRVKNRIMKEIEGYDDVSVEIYKYSELENHFQAVLEE